MARTAVITGAYGYLGVRIRVGLNKAGWAVRAGLVYGIDASGTDGTPRALKKLPVTSVMSAAARHVPVHVPGFARAVVRIFRADTWEPEVFGIAKPNAVSLAEILRNLARQDGQQVRLVPVRFRTVYLVVRIVELVASSLGIRADSVIVVVKAAPSVPMSRAFPDPLDTLTAVDAVASSFHSAGS